MQNKLIFSLFILNFQQIIQQKFKVHNFCSSTKQCGRITTAVSAQYSARPLRRVEIATQSIGREHRKNTNNHIAEYLQGVLFSVPYNHYTLLPGNFDIIL